MGFVNIGFGNIINTDKVVAIISPDSSPARRMVQNARESHNIIDATQGRRTRALVIAENGNVILSALLPETIASRTKGKDIISDNSRGEEDE